MPKRCVRCGAPGTDDECAVGCGCIAVDYEELREHQLRFRLPRKDEPELPFGRRGIR